MTLRHKIALTAVVLTACFTGISVSGAPAFAGASGGGCTNPGVLYFNGLNWDAEEQIYLKACISENSSHEIVAGAQIGLTFLTEQHRYIVHCWYTINIRDDSVPTTVAKYTANGCGYISTGHPLTLKVNARPGHHYHTYLWAKYQLNDGSILDFQSRPCVNSPEQIAG